MEILIIVTATLCATSLMTCFSYAVSESFRELYKEPVLLNYVLKLRSMDIAPPLKKISGWAIHYGIGLAFVIAYHFIWLADGQQATWLSAGAYGIGIGILGIAGWQVLFRFSDYKAGVSRMGYYCQLFIAHLIFAFTMVGIYKLFEGRY